MLEIKKADSFIEKFEKGYGKKIYRVPFYLRNGEKAAILMCKCNGKYISLPYLSQGVIETSAKKFDLNGFPKRWEIRDIIQYSEYCYREKVVFEYDLMDKQFSYSSKIKRKINKSKQSVNVISLDNPSYSQINTFYLIYSQRMYQIGVPPISKKEIIDRINSLEYILFIAYFGGDAIGVASINKITTDYFENEFFATLSDYNYLYPSYALHDAMILYSRQNNAKKYSFGRSSIDSSVYKFKKHWRAKEIPLYWSYSTKTASLRNNKWIFRLWRLLPYRISNFLGGFIHKRIY